MLTGLTWLIVGLVVYWTAQISTKNFKKEEEMTDRMSFEIVSPLVHRFRTTVLSRNPSATVVLESNLHC
jgi:hypothetical protein